jgi:hypothetical protein
MAIKMCGGGLTIIALLVALSYLAFGQLVDRKTTLLVNVLGSLMMNLYYMSVRQLHPVYELVHDTYVLIKAKQFISTIRLIRDGCG